MLDVSGEGARTQSMIWVSGAGSAAWPDLPNQRLELSADNESYKAGDTARIFIPNPFPVNSLALVTVERGVISQSEVVTLSGSGREYSLPLTEADAPNVYVSAIVLGQGNDFRGGLVNPVRRQRSRFPPTIVSTVSATASNLAARAASSSAALSPLSL